MPAKKDIKKDLDAVLAKEFTDEELKNLRLFFKIASWNRIEEAMVTQSSPIIPSKSCQSEKLLEVSGIAATGSNGTVQLRLSRFICFDPASFDTPINVVATPLTSGPCYLTLNHSLVINPDTGFGIDVEIDVFTWNAKGAPAPGIPFDWRCRVVFYDLIL